VRTKIVLVIFGALGTITYEVVCYLLYVKHNYMFRPQILAIFRLYNENLSISYTCVCRGCRGCREGV
jgi:hypothetical protein